MKIKLLVLFLLILSLSSCISVISSANHEYSEREISKAIVMVDMHDKYALFGMENNTYYVTFQETIKNLLWEKYNIESKVFIKNLDPFNDIDYADEAAKLNTDTFVYIVQGQTLIDQYKKEIDTTYKVKVYDLINEKPMWQGEIHFTPPVPPLNNSGFLAKTLIDTMSSQMNKDGMVLMTEDPLYSE